MRAGRTPKVRDGYAAKWIDRLLQQSVATLPTSMAGHWESLFGTHFATDSCNAGTPVFRASRSRCKAYPLGNCVTRYNFSE